MDSYMRFSCAEIPRNTFQLPERNHFFFQTFFELLMHLKGQNHFLLLLPMQNGRTFLTLIRTFRPHSQAHVYMCVRECQQRAAGNP